MLYNDYFFPVIIFGVGVAFTLIFQYRIKELQKIFSRPKVDQKHESSSESSSSESSESSSSESSSTESSSTESSSDSKNNEDLDHLLDEKVEENNDNKKYEDEKVEEKDEEEKDEDEKDEDEKDNIEESEDEESDFKNTLKFLEDEPFDKVRVTVNSMGYKLIQKTSDVTEKDIEISLKEKKLYVKVENDIVQEFLFK